MRSISVANLTQLIRSGDVPNMEVHAVELAIYVCFMRIEDALVPLADEAGKVIQYRSRYPALRALKEIGVRAADFVHVSSYDEMIGLPSAEARAEYRERVDLSKLPDV